LSYFTHGFEAPIERHGIGTGRVVWYRVLFLPERLAAELPFDKHPRLRVEGEIAEVPVSGAFIPSGDGRRYFIVSPAVLKTAEVAVGDTVEMRFRVDDQDRVDLPDALARALAAHPGARARFEALSPGARRGLTHRVGSAKTDATRLKRVEEVLAELLGLKDPPRRRIRRSG
jgi:hypothetical protein